jgi:hypothetical protein
MTTGDDIGAGIQTVGSVVAPIVGMLAPEYGKAVTIAFKVLAKVEPAAWNAVAALLQKQDLTPEQKAALIAIEANLARPDSYLG